MCIQILVCRKIKRRKKCQINQGLGRGGVQSDIDALKAITLNPTLNTSGWTQNYSTAFREGDMIFVNIYVLGSPAANKNIMSGLPKPDKDSSLYFCIPSSLGNSIGAVLINGAVTFSSPGTTSSGYFGAFVAYKTNE